MEKDIDIFEYAWWRTFTWYAFLLILSIYLIYDLYNLLDKHILVLKFLGSRSIMNVIWYLVPISGCIFELPNMFNLFSVPKLLIFKENSIIVVSPMNSTEKYFYKDISHLIICRNSKWSEGRRWMSSRFMAKLYLSEYRKKVMFNPERLFNCDDLLKYLRNKGLDHLIEQKYI